MWRAYQASDVKTATLLTDLAKRLENEYPSAAGSVRDGLDETVTVLTLHLSTHVQRSLATTNAAESLLSRTRHVKRFLIVPVWELLKLAVNWKFKSRFERKRLRILGQRLLDRLGYYGQVATGGILWGSAVAWLLFFIINAPPAIPQGHGSVAGVLPSSSTAYVRFPLPDRLRPPETIEKTLPVKKPRLSVVEPKRLSIEDIVAQLPVAEAVEFEQAPRPERVLLAPPAPPTEAASLAAALRSCRGSRPEATWSPSASSTTGIDAWWRPRYP